MFSFFQWTVVWVVGQPGVNAQRSVEKANKSDIEPVQTPFPNVVGTSATPHWLTRSHVIVVEHVMVKT